MTKEQNLVFGEKQITRKIIFAINFQHNKQKGEITYEFQQKDFFSQINNKLNLKITAYEWV